MKETLINKATEGHSAPLRSGRKNGLYERREDDE
jgi:hypothetical protein